jgi:hypothetical protein
MLLELSKPEACVRLKCSAATLDRWVKAGKVQARKSEVFRAGKQGVVIVLEVPDPAPIPAPAPEPAPEPTPETASTLNYVDSMGNTRMTPKDQKISLLGRNPELPAKEIVRDAAYHAAMARASELGISFEELPRDNNGNPLPRGMTREAYLAGVAADRKYHSRSEQQRRAEHDRQVIAASFPRGEKR